MKSSLIIANWKMKLGLAESLALAKKLAKSAAKNKNVEVVICPAFTELAAVGEIIKGSGLKLGAQDCFWEEAGAFTGAISPKNLQEYGVEYVLVGHSERREHLAETNDMIHKKIRLLLSLGLMPVLCIGESFSERQEGLKEAVLIGEIHKALDGLLLNKLGRLVIAYEPIWVIGSGQAVEAAEAEHTHQAIKHALYDIFPRQAVDEQVKIIYGGSVDPGNIKPFLAEPTVRGVLVGTSSLDATIFSAIIATAAKI
ncbi:MAG: triose-phosphate isomerase [Patescibacteria group bacterium]